MVPAADSAEIRPTGGNVRTHAYAAALALLVLGAVPALAASSYSLTLDPVAYDNSTRDIILGEGRVSATLDGATLRITGNFTGLSSPATAAKLGVAQGFGIPTTEFFATLTPTNGQNGSISGTVTLTPAQVAAVSGKQLFLQLNTVRGTDGALWGWFEPAKAVPSKGGKK
jgi:hypothetical protein